MRVAIAQHHIDLPAYVIPGVADGCISIELGYGRWVGGPIAEGVGANAYRLRVRAHKDRCLQG